ncbi:hypothetical protein QBC46DRAFT_422266 [Diplogelasinospora grovesii]|uniref:Uncharacterized protein n=1 Tax=Diplogelasinospora grovesii TaxID=303347 RepID=A0AAN6NC84_9PEZI|nr:hypothetical protein QBC46DRAFT_422266 [Diplogelasinospora grovesii]
MQPATLETAAGAARQLDLACLACPLEHQQEAEDYLRMVWEVMVDVVRSPDVTSEIHERLIWRNLNSFAARCLRAGVLGSYTQVTYALRAALEELIIDHDIDETECRIQVVCEWISHGAKHLLWWARENIGYFDVTEEDLGQYIPPGPQRYFGVINVITLTLAAPNSNFQFRQELVKAAIKTPQNLTSP